MLAEFTEFLFDNHKKDNFIELAVDKLIEILPEDEASEEFALKLLQVLQNELILLPNGYAVNLILHVTTKDEVRIYLTPTEQKILEVLVQNRGKIVTYNYLIKMLWKYAEDNSILKVNISNLRQKVDIPIKSIKGIGYTVDS